MLQLTKLYQRLCQVTEVRKYSSFELREYVNPLRCREKEYYMQYNEEFLTSVLHENICLHNEKDNENTV